MNHIASRDPVNGRGKSNGKAPRLAPAKIRADEVELHPLVEAFPELPRDELGRMAEILREAGASASFLICGDQLIDSRNRFAACRLAGVEIEFREWKDSGLSVAGSLAETVARLNLPPHLDDARRAALGVPVLIALQLENQARQRKGLRAGRNTQKTAVLAKSPVAANLQRREISPKLRFSEYFYPLAILSVVGPDFRAGERSKPALPGPPAVRRPDAAAD